MEKQWIDNLRKRFADRKAPVPEGLWDDIESAMAKMDMPVKTDGSKKRAHVVALWGRWAVAVVAVVAVVLGVVKYNSLDTPVVTAGDKLAQDVAHASAEKPAAQTENDYADETVDAGRSVWSRFKLKVAGAVEEVSEHSAEVIAWSDIENNIPADNTVGEGMDDTEERQRKSVAVVNCPPDGHKSKYYSTNNDDMLASASKPNNGMNVSVGLYGANFMSVGASANRGASAMPINTYGDPVLNKDFVMMTAISSNLNKAKTEENEVKVKHRQPVRVGMSVRLKLTDRLGVETGMNYSYLSSDMGSGDDEGGFRTEQKLHYVGVPLGLNYDIWKTDFLEVYAVAGAMAEFCVSGNSSTEYVSDNTVVKRTETDVKDSRPQWSVNGAAGVQYNFNDIVGVYVEPGVSYYFNNGSSVTTIYKDKPFNFNLNLGLRFTVK